MLSTVDNATDAILDDWAYWVRDRSSRGRTCQSIECRYRHDAIDEGKRQPRRMVDVEMCRQVEAAITAPNFPRQARVLLVGWYVLRSSRMAICARAHVILHDLEFEVGLAARLAIKSLTNQKNTTTHRIATPTYRDELPGLVPG